MESNFCIIEYQGKYYQAYPITQKIVTRDSKKELIEFDLEFQIKNGN
jgi:phage-related protein